MATQFADVELVASPVPPLVAERSNESVDNYESADDAWILAPRGIIIAILISLPFWALAGFTIYILI